MNYELISQIREGGILYILLLIAITMHEFGHAWFADKLGDPLPRLQGRVTVNPLAHIDPFGTVILPLLTIAVSIGANFPIVFGWGKPVQVALNDAKNRDKIDLFSTLGAPAFFRRPGCAASMDLRAAGAESCRPRIRAACPAQKALRVSREGRGNRGFASSAPAGGRHEEGTKSVDGSSLPVKNASAVVSCRLR